MKNTVCYILPLSLLLSLSACSRILYEETDIHYVERCETQSCDSVLGRLKAQCKGEVIDAYVKRKSAIVQCRPAKPVDPKAQGTPEVKPQDAHVTPKVEDAVKKEIQK